MKLSQLPPTLRRWCLRSLKCPDRTVSNVTGIPFKRVSSLHDVRSLATEDENTRIAAFFGVSPEFMREAWEVVNHWQKVRTTGCYPSA